MTTNSIVHVTDTKGREWLGQLTKLHEYGEVRWVTLCPAYLYIVQVQQTPQGPAVQRGLQLPHLLEGSDVVELQVTEITYLREDNSDWQTLVPEAERMRSAIRAQSTGIQLAGPGDMPRARA